MPNLHLTKKALNSQGTGYYIILLVELQPIINITIVLSRSWKASPPLLPAAS